jgi:hypothetical protein
VTGAPGMTVGRSAWNVVLVGIALAVVQARRPAPGRRDAPSLATLWRTWTAAGDTRTLAGIRPLQGRVFQAVLPHDVLGDEHGRSAVALAEDGRPLPRGPVPPQPAQIARDGGGLHVVVGRNVLFSTPDGSPAHRNGRRYTSTVTLNGRPMPPPDAGHPARAHWERLEALFAGALTAAAVETGPDAVVARDVRLCGHGIGLRARAVAIAVPAADALHLTVEAVLDDAGGPDVTVRLRLATGPAGPSVRGVEVAAGGGSLAWDAGDPVLRIEGAAGLGTALLGLAGGSDALVGWVRWIRAMRLDLGEGVAVPEGAEAADPAAVLFDEIAAWGGWGMAR